MRRLDDVTVVVLAPNPSVMTLDGTNTYLLGAPGIGEVVVVDPGPAIAAHRDAIDEAVAAMDATIVAVVVTHHHADHAEAVGWASEWSASLFACDPRLVADAVHLQDEAAVARGGVTLTAIHTPGHSSDHLCLRVDDTGVVLTGDHVLGRGTTVVAWPDGDMGAYMDSLRRLQRVDATALYPGHGPVVHDPAAVVADYLSHRLEREAQVVAALAGGATTAREVVAVVYSDVDPALHPAAERSVRAHLDQLCDEGRVVRVVDPTVAAQETFRVR